MKIEEAINIFKSGEDITPYYDDHEEAIGLAIEALEMRSRKPVNKNICPYCGKLLSIHHNFCPDCGQALLWKSGECSECIHNSKNWDEEPCDGCCGGHSGFEQK